MAAAVLVASAFFATSTTMAVSTAQAKPGDVAAARSALLHYGRSMQAKDWKAACVLMTARAHHQVIADARTYKHAKTRNCAAAYAATFRGTDGKEEQPITPEWIKALKTAKIVVRGDTATAMGYTLLLTRGRWLVST